MKVKARVETIFKEFKIPKAGHKARNLIARILYGFSFANALSEEAKGGGLRLEINQDPRFLQELILIHGPWIPDLYKVILLHCSEITDVEHTNFMIGDRFLVSCGQIKICDLMSEFFNANPDGNVYDFASLLIDEMKAFEVEHASPIAIRYYW